MSRGVVAGIVVLAAAGAVAAGYAVGTQQGASAAPCAARGVLPSRRCTPGATADRKRAVVCAPGYATAHRPLFNDPAFLKLKAEARAEYGRSGRAFVVDHLVPLELGGASVLANLWPEPVAEARRKDAVENRLHDLVCSGQMRLAHAVHIFRVDWTKGEG